MTLENATALVDELVRAAKNEAACEERGIGAENVAASAELDAIYDKVVAALIRAAP